MKDLVYSTLCRYRNWLAQDDPLSELLELINCQLAEKKLKVEKASAAVIDATIIQTAGSKQRQAIEVDEEGQVSGQTHGGNLCKSSISIPCPIPRN